VETLFVAIVVAIALLGGCGLHHRRWLRRSGRWALLLVFVVTSLLTLSLLGLAAASAAKGGGVLLLFALPIGLVAAIAGGLWWASVGREDYHQLTTEQKIEHNLALHERTVAELERSIAQKLARRSRLFVSWQQRRQLDREIAAERAILERLPALRPALSSPATYAADEA
jgi:hypothetical protein